MVVIRIETLGDERFVRGFNRYVEDVKDFTEVFDDIAEDFFRTNKRNFKAGGTPEAFAPLSPRYEEWKRRHYPGKPILRLTDRLYNSLTAEKQADAQDTIRIIRKDSAEFGTRVPYASRHQMGRGLPRRKPVQLTDEDKSRWASMIQRWAYRKLQERLT